MTELAHDSALSRETAVNYKGRPIIVELHPGYMVVRLKGKRSEKYMLSYNAAFEAAARAEYLRQRNGK